MTERIRLGLVALLMIALAAAVYMHGMPLAHGALQDHGGALDGGWRVLNGQRPQVDFAAPLGPVHYLLIAAAMSAFGPRYDALVNATVIALPIAGLTAFLALPRRDRFGLRIWFVLAMTSVAVFGHDLWLSYNALGFVFTISVVMAIGSLADAPPRTGLSGFLAGLCLSILLFLKANFFLVAAAYAIAALIVDRPTRRFAVALVGTVTLLAGSMLAYLRFDLAAILQNTLAGILLRGKGVFDMPANVSALADSLPLVLLPAFGTVWIWRYGGSRPGRQRWGLTATILLLLASGQALYASGSTRGVIYASAMSLPCLYLIARFADSLPRREGQPGRSNGERGLSWAVLTEIFCAGIFLLGMVESFRDLGHVLIDGRYLRDMPSFTAPRLAATRPAPGADIDYVEAVNEATEFVEANLQPGRPVELIDFSNVVSFATNRPGPRRNLVWWHEGYSFSAVRYPAADDVLEGVDLVLVRRPNASSSRECRDTVRLRTRLWRDYLSRHFHAESDLPRWHVLRRSPGLPTQPPGF